MFRCAFAYAVLATAALTAAGPASAQVNRPFPANALRGEMTVVQPPDIKLNGVPARLAPGARIRGPNNLMLMSASVVGQPLPVHYTLDNEGQVQLVWVLTEQELAKKPWPTTLKQAAEWRFDPLAQAWSRP